MALYAAYGSNMDSAQMLERCPHSPQRGTGWLEGWRLTFGGEDLGWDGALTTVVESPGDRVFVVLYDVPEVDEKSLDAWDGVTLGYYRKLKVRIETLDGDVLAWLYVLDAWEGGLPSERHVTLLADAAVRAGAPEDYVSSLRARPCNPSLAAAPSVHSSAPASGAPARPALRPRAHVLRSRARPRPALPPRRPHVRRSRERPTLPPRVHMSDISRFGPPVMAVRQALGSRPAGSWTESVVGRRFSSRVPGRPQAAGTPGHL